MAIIDDTRLELQLDTTDFSDESIQYAIDQVGSDNLYLVCAYVLQMLLNKNRSRRQLTIGSFNESVDVKDLRKRIRTYRSLGAGSDDGTYTAIEDSDHIFTVGGI